MTQAVTLAQLLPIISQFGLPRIGNYIESQLDFFTFQTWGDWHHHATEVCHACKVVLDRLEELDYEFPAADKPIAEVIAYLKAG